MYLFFGIVLNREKMDQIILNQGISESASAPQRKGMLSQLNPLEGLVDQVMGKFLDTYLFVGSGRSMYAWRMLMDTLQQYNIAYEKNYLQVGQEADKYIQKLRTHKQVAYFDDFDSVALPPDQSQSLKIGFKTSASEFIFCCIKNHDRLLNKITDMDLKRKVGNFLMHAINIEQDEYKMIESSMKKKTSPPLGINEVIDLNYPTEFEQSIADEIKASIDKFEDVKFVSLVSSLGNPETTRRKSPWYFALAFKQFCTEKSLWSVKESEIEPQFDILFKELASESLNSNSNFLYGPEKRMCESCYQICHLHAYMSVFLTKQEDKADELYVKLMYDMPQVIAHGCCIDKYRLLDVNFRKNLDRVMSIAKEKIREEESRGDDHSKSLTALMQFIKEPRKYMDREFKFSTSEQFVKQKIEEYLRHAIHSAMDGFAHEVYEHFLHPRQMAKVTVPLLLSALIEHEFSFYAKKYSPPFARKFFQYLIYSSCPLLFSGLVSIQEEALSSAAAS